MLTGMYKGQSVHLGRIAAKVHVGSKVTSVTMRFRRFLANKAVRVRRWYGQLAQQLLTQAALCGEIRLIADGTKIGSGHQLLMVAIAYRKRALPIAWTWVKGARGHSSTIKQLALLRYVYTLVPADVPVVVVGDCEFGAVEVARHLERWRWSYVLRQPSNTQVCISRQRLTWQDFGALVAQRNQLIWYEQAIVTLKHLHHASLLGYWECGEKTPWLLMTNLPKAYLALRTYRRRMWIEEMFGDWKGHGVDIEKTRLRHVQRLSRLVFIVALLYLWLVSRGAQTIKSGDRHLVDRSDRRDLSVFRIGLYIVDRRLARAQPLSLRLVPYF
jgi:hypothetical protein